jgi:type IV secretory pathway TrbL component
LKTNVICKIVGIMLQVFLILAVAMIIYAAYLYATARGESEQVSKAHKTLTWAVVAIMVAVLASAIPTIVSTFVGGGERPVCPGVFGSSSSSGNSTVQYPATSPYRQTQAYGQASPQQQLQPSGQVPPSARPQTAPAGSLTPSGAQGPGGNIIP